MTHIFVKAWALSCGLIGLMSAWQPAEAAWIKCADEYNKCNITGTKQILYGQSTTAKYVVKNMTNTFWCTNQALGSDPAVNIAKGCWYNDGVTTTPPVTPTTWTKCANEFGMCNFTGTRRVAFGVTPTSQNITKSFTNVVGCFISNFGYDPAVNVPKSCWVESSSSSGSTPPVVTDPPVVVNSPATGSGLALKPFSSASPWNTPISASATYAPVSDSRVQALRNRGGGLNIKKDIWTQWVWIAKESDPSVTFSVSALNLPSNINEPFYKNNPANARPGMVTLKMPSNAHPDPGCFGGDQFTCPNGRRTAPWADNLQGYDGHLIIIDPSATYAHEFWHTGYNESSRQYTAVGYARIPLNGLGVNISGEYTQKTTGSYYNPAFLTYGWGPTRAYGGSALGGTIRKGELTSGQAMNHALSILIPAEIMGLPASGLPLYPATHLEHTSQYKGNIVLGTRIAIPRGVNVNALGLSPAGVILARTFQEYGAFIIDSNGGGLNLQADGVAAQGDANAVNYNDLSTILNQITIVNPEGVFR